MISEMILPEWDMEMANSRKILACVPDGKFDYKPHEKSMTLGRLASHVAEMAGWAKETMSTEKLEIDASFKPYTAATSAELLEFFDKCASASRAAIAAAKDEDYPVMWSLVFSGRTAFSMPRAVCLRSMVINHHIHHRAQLGVYLRLLGVEIPGMYGPSADERAAAAAKA
jgi:uncharacterized damage-inducible protein DinB